MTKRALSGDTMRRLKTTVRPASIGEAQHSSTSTQKNKNICDEIAKQSLHIFAEHYNAMFKPLRKKKIESRFSPLCFLPAAEFAEWMKRG